MISLRDGMMGWGLAGTGNSSTAAAVAVVASGGGGGGVGWWWSKWKSQNRVGFLKNRVEIKEKAHESAKNEKNGI